MPQGAHVSPRTLRQLAALHVTFDATTFHAAGDGTATVNAVASRGATRQRWVVTLVRNDGRWKLAATSLAAG